MITTAHGAKTYTGKPCKHRHSGERYASNRVCLGCNHVRGNQNEWQKEHPENHRAARRRYYAKNKTLLNIERGQHRRLQVARNKAAAAQLQGTSP